MTENNYTDYTDFDDDYNSYFRGLIFPSDFNSYGTPGNIAQRIASDYAFNKQCKKNTISRDKNKKKEKERNVE